MMTGREESRLEGEFLETALRRSEFLRRNEPKKANKEHDRLHRLKEKMRRLPDRGEGALKRAAAATEDPDARILVAAALLAVDEAFATTLLEQIRIADVGLPSFTAEVTLKEWRAGAIRGYWS